MCMDRVIIVCGTFWLYALVSLYYKFRTKQYITKCLNLFNSIGPLYNGDECGLNLNCLKYDGFGFPQGTILKAMSKLSLHPCLYLLQTDVQLSAFHVASGVASLLML